MSEYKQNVNSFMALELRWIQISVDDSQKINKLFKKSGLKNGRRQFLDIDSILAWN